MYLFVLECHHPTQSVNRVRENIHAAAQGPTLMLVLCLPVCLSICWSICLWIHLPICPSARTSLAHTFTPASSSATRLILVPPFCFCEAHSPSRPITCASRPAEWEQAQVSAPACRLLPRAAPPWHTAPERATSGLLPPPCCCHPCSCSGTIQVDGSSHQ